MLDENNNITFIWSGKKLFQDYLKILYIILHLRKYSIIILNYTYRHDIFYVSYM